MGVIYKSLVTLLLINDNQTVHIYSLIKFKKKSHSNRFMEPHDWLYHHEKFFSTDLNGYSRPPIGPYLSTLPLIDRDGKIMDLGCGNGMLLKFLQRFSGHQLVPFGIDHKELPIVQARTEVLPEHVANFQVADVNDYRFEEGPFDLIISNPVYAGSRMRQFTEHCLAHLSPGGRLIYRLHDDVVRANNLSRPQEHPAFQDLGMRVSQGAGLLFCVFDR